MRKSTDWSSRYQRPPATSAVTSGGGIRLIHRLSSTAAPRRSARSARSAGSGSVGRAHARRTGPGSCQSLDPTARVDPRLESSDHIRCIEAEVDQRRRREAGCTRGRKGVPAALDPPKWGVRHSLPGATRHSSTVRGMCSAPGTTPARARVSAALMSMRTASAGTSAGSYLRIRARAAASSWSIVAPMPARRILRGFGARCNRLRSRATARSRPPQVDGWASGCDCPVAYRFTVTVNRARAMLALESVAMQVTRVRPMRK
jgi:hypothetical protein